MGRRNSLSEIQRIQIVILHCEELSEQKIIIKIKINENAVHQAIKKFQLYDLRKNLKKIRKLIENWLSRPRPDQTDNHKVVNKLCQENSRCINGSRRWSE